MATSGYSKPSILPWQPVAPGRFALDLLNPAGRPAHTLHLYLSATDNRWRWHITPYSQHEALRFSRHEGYTRRHLAERALMFALRSILHPAADLPTSLPPCEGAISASRRGE